MSHFSVSDDKKTKQLHSLRSVQINRQSARAGTTGKEKETNTRSLGQGGGRACYTVGEWRRDEGNGWIENYSYCER
jgi:hypothetical protein